MGNCLNSMSLIQSVACTQHSIGVVLMRPISAQTSTIATLYVFCEHRILIHYTCFVKFFGHDCAKLRQLAAMLYTIKTLIVFNWHMQFCRQASCWGWGFLCAARFGSFLYMDKILYILCYLVKKRRIYSPRIDVVLILLRCSKACRIAPLLLRYTKA